MSSRNAQALDGLTLLGNQNTHYPSEYQPSVLEAVPNLHAARDYFVKFNCPEFTSLCPLTGQPNFATIYISYIPDEKLVESKSLKPVSYTHRTLPTIQEDCINEIILALNA